MVVSRVCAIGLLAACSDEPRDARPSIVLVAVDTLRADAVSAYGAVERTTPAFDQLAADGLLYTRAFAPSPWTLPSHASLLTGLGVERHAVGIAGRMGLGEQLTTLAERLGQAGYQTAGFSENPLVSNLFGFAQGFERFSATTIDDVIHEEAHPDDPRFDVVREVAAGRSSCSSTCSIRIRRIGTASPTASSIRVSRSPICGPLRRCRPRRAGSATGFPQRLR